MKNNKIRYLVITFTMVLLLACGSCQQATSPSRVQQAQSTVKTGQRINFEERKQIARAEEILDQPGVYFFVYFFSQTGDLIDEIVCEGRPNSSTESLEPQSGQMLYNITSTSGLGLYPFRVTIDEPGQEDTTVYTNELMGRDGTWGDPVPYLYCVTPAGNYEQWSPYVMYRISDTPKMYGQKRARVDADLMARKLRAEEALKRGQCVDNELNIVTCREASPTPMPIGPNPTPTGR